MVSLDEAVTARLDSHGHRFEILVDPDLALAAKEQGGEGEIDLDELLATDAVFEDASAALRASDDALQEAFSSTELEAVVRGILQKGELQLTTEQRREMQEQKRKAIVNRIARLAVNPQTGNPHPPKRIENAMEEAGVHIDPFEGVEPQMQEVVKALRPLLPIKFETIQLAVRLPADVAGKAYGFVRSYGDLVKEEWQNDGAWVGVIKFPSGQQADFYDALNDRVHGEAETKIIERE